MLRKEKRRASSFNYFSKLPASRHDMPGWNDCNQEEFNEIHARNFMLWLWETLYEEPFVPADLSQYRLRIDKPFRDNPDNPELWGNEPKYLSWEDWDLMHQGKMKWYYGTEKVTDLFSP